ncbi:MAG: hypothetical protein GXO62_00775 [Epsilonproteobacteria bacterium]|nr:hypothetical protein [Campylobacterota bacterium]
MAYELIIQPDEKMIEVHSDLCDKLMEKKDDFSFNSKAEYINVIDFNEVNDIIQKEYPDYSVLYCDMCEPDKRSEEYDEEYDDFYEEFDDDEEIDNSRCNIF